MENWSYIYIVDCPIKISIYRGFPIAVFDSQRVSKIIFDNDLDKNLALNAGVASRTFTTGALKLRTANLWWNIPRCPPLANCFGSNLDTRQFRCQLISTIFQHCLHLITTNFKTSTLPDFWRLIHQPRGTSTMHMYYNGVPETLTSVVNNARERAVPFGGAFQQMRVFKPTEPPTNITFGGPTL